MPNEESDAFEPGWGEGGGGTKGKWGDWGGATQHQAEVGHSTGPMSLSGRAFGEMGHMWTRANVLAKAF